MNLNLGRATGAKVHAHPRLAHSPGKTGLLPSKGATAVFPTWTLRPNGAVPWLSSMDSPSADEMGYPVVSCHLLP